MVRILITNAMVSYANLNHTKVMRWVLTPYKRFLYYFCAKKATWCMSIYVRKSKHISRECFVPRNNQVLNTWKAWNPKGNTSIQYLSPWRFSSHALNSCSQWNIEQYISMVVSLNTCLIIMKFYEPSAYKFNIPAPPKHLGVVR